MPKRVADDYITKEHGSTANSVTGDDKPKMSTAAQLAKRKMATPRGRLGANRPAHPSSSSSQANPSVFGQNATQQQQTFNMNGGVTFGASQSFPTGASSGFNFQPPQSSSFTFGAPSSTPNPFASLNGTGDATNNQAHDIAMESPQKKPAAFGAGFGSSTAGNAPSTGTFSFGQSTQQPAGGTFTFGASQNASNAPATNGGSLFGQVSQPENASAPANPFGQSSQPASTFGGFGQTTSAAQTGTPSFSFGQTSSSAPASTTAPSFTFGQSTSASQNAPPAFNLGQGSNDQSQPPKFVFGQAASASESQAQTTAPSFGSNTTPGQSGGNTFGSGTAPPNQPSNMGFGSSATSAFSFGQAQSQDPPAQSNPFASLGTSKSDETKAAGALFGSPANLKSGGGGQQPTSPERPATPSADSNPQSATNPFAGLFASANPTTPSSSGPKAGFSFGAASQHPAQATETSEQKTSTPAFKFGGAGQSESAPTPVPEAKAAKPAFSFGNAIQSSPQLSHTPASSATENRLPSTSLFGAKPVEQEGGANVEATSLSTPPSESVQTKKNNEVTSTSGFNFPQPQSSGGLFSPAKTPAKNASASGFSFGKPSKADDAPQFHTDKPPPAESPFKFSSNSGTSAETTSTPPSFGGTPRPQPQQVQATPKTMGTPAPLPSAARQTGQLSASKPTSSVSSTAPGQESLENRTAPPETLKRPVYTNAPSRTPGHIDAEQFREYDRDYRLHSLNVGLQKILTGLDPRSHDFDNVVRHYVAARDSVGASLGLYVRSVAGSKRKGDNVDDRDEEPSRNKRTRSEDVHPASISHTQTNSTSTITGFPSQNSTPKPFGAFNGPVNDSKFSKPTKPLEGQLSEPTPSGVAAASSGFKPAGNPFAGLSSNSTANANPFGQREQGAKPPSTESLPPSTTPTKSPPKKPSFEVPKFGSGNTNFLGAFGQKAKTNSDKFEKDLREKRKAEDFDSDEDDEETFNKQAEEEMRAKRAKIDAISRAGFTPSFGSSTPASKPSFSFGSNTPSTKPTFGFGGVAGQSKEQSTFSSSGVTPSLSPSNPFSAQSTAETSCEQSQVSENDDDEDSGSEYEDDGEDEEGDDEDAEDDLPEDEVLEENVDEGDDDDDDDDNDLQAAMDKAKQNPNAGRSLFDRIERKVNPETTAPMNGDKQESGEPATPAAQSAKSSPFKPAVWGSQTSKSTTEAPSFSPITPSSDAVKSSYKPATTFNFTAATPTTSSSPTPGASIFAGGLTRGGPVPGEGLFGSRPSTPSNAEKNASSLAKAVLTSPAGTDNTWKAGTPISFANGDANQSAPSFKFTAASPGENGDSTPRPFGTLFGTATGGSNGSDTPNQLGFQFGAPAAPPAPGYLGAISHLGGGSVASSNASSRATSPGLTDNESVATNETDEAPNDPQTSLMESRAGEENETCLWEGRSKALMFVNQDTAQGTKMTPNDWNSMGVGLIRVLKDKTTGKTRVVFRVEPSASILINSHLVEGVTYENVPSTKSGAVKGALFYKGNLNRWVFKLKTPQMGEELSKLMEDNKKA